MNLMKECANQLMALAGVDPNDCVAEMAKYAVAERLAKSDNRCRRFWATYGSL